MGFGCCNPCGFGGGYGGGYGNGYGGGFGGGYPVAGAYYGRGRGFALIVVLFILLIIVGASRFGTC